MIRRSRRAFLRSLPTCRAAHADGGACRHACHRAYLPGERVMRRGDARVLVAMAAAIGGFR